jgi:hypothetical protein
MSAASLPAAQYAISEATKQLMPNDCKLEAHLYRHVDNEFFCSPEQTQSGQHDNSRGAESARQKVRFTQIPSLLA